MEKGIDDQKLAKAISVAAYSHCGQVDKQGQPYIRHPLRVMENMAKWGYTGKFLIVAVLHDVVEDTIVSLDEIEAYFDKEIRDAIDALTRREGETYNDFIIRAKQNLIAFEVKWYDINDNLNRSDAFPSLKKRYTNALETHWNNWQPIKKLVIPTE